ncbi:MAG: type IVB secretion system protein IcmH/DotU [Cellvibrionaceae bacterium]|nr:type IVB secretion system protein IcmH/DotU [Cellvibrionaceae bacterium]
MGNNNNSGGDGDRTVIIPTPGAARQPNLSQPATPVQSRQSPDPLVQPAGDFAAPLEVEQGLNPLVAAASTLLTVAIKLRSTMQHNNPPQLHKQLTEEIRNFELKAKNSTTNQDSVLAARYLLCTVVDEIVLSTPWGAGSGWSQHSLLSLFHKDISGGEKCFDVLRKLLETPSKHLDLLELFYLCLSLGFRGKYKLVQRGQEQLEQIRDNLFRTVEKLRGEMERDLSPRWRGLYNRKRNLVQFVPLWVIASCVFAALVVSYSGFRWWLYASTEPTVQQVESLSSEP